ncbi:MAG: N-acetyl-gamma-glutamyl-phosphate reductase [Candidatus Lokiarchaeota archaeon]|nr:N-acetyl-gamma-glutamyl-phosphate reductase [Candidatus Lokiarchaeota archaeon]
MKVGIIGGSGFAGGTLLQILLQHPNVEVTQVTSRSLVGKYIHMIHPNLKSISKNIKFELFKVDNLSDKCDLVFTAIPHGTAHKIIPELLEVGLKVIDLSADYRIKDVSIYEHYYVHHESPDLIQEAVYGMPELHRDAIKGANLIAGPGCHASSAIYALAPLIANDLIETENMIVDSKTGSSGSGHKVSESSHHPFRENSIRPYKMTGHRHTAEIEQELGFVMNEEKYNEVTNNISVGFSAHGVNLIRGILSTCHVFTKENKEIDEKTVIKSYRKFYRKEPFIRFMKQKTGIYRLPDPKLIGGTNYVDVGFELDDHLNRIVALCALDNLVKGAAGNAVQCMNLMAGFDETTALTFPGLFP